MLLRYTLRSRPLLKMIQPGVMGLQHECVDVTYKPRHTTDSVVNTPQIQRNAPVSYSSRKSVTLRTGLTGLSVLVA